VSDSPLLEVRDLVKNFPGKGGQPQRAVDRVSIVVRRGETFGLVGESGSGKSTLARCVLRLLRPDSGQVRFDGQDVGALRAAAMRRLRQRIQVVFQDPHGSLNPGQTVGEIVAAPLHAHRVGSRVERAARVTELLELVQLPRQFAQRRPADLSGGQAQRVAIARALALRPDFVVLDEAVSALDVSIRAQVLNLLASLQRDLGLAYLFISHDLAVVRYMSTEIGVMYRGRIVETAPRQALFDAPQHPYTRLLLAAVPTTDPGAERRPSGRGPDGEEATTDLTRGCRFLPRCDVGRRDCAQHEPPLRLLADPTRRVACHYPGVTP
jgi:oligopeptide/dipeptide ABC transporter ATP-binding protein